YRTADFNDSFCHAAQPWQRIIQPWRIDGGVKIQLLNAKLAFYTKAESFSYNKSNMNSEINKKIISIVKSTGITYIYGEDFWRMQ
ncbi:hypothetical protein ONO12_27605, partial [Salmonella enterica subsp. enterica serovar Montevideo]|nr:hypothetical protein [Salmonella enterica subsp. enterica serovar Montevideo]